MKGDGFIREVDEAVRQDRWLTIGRKYGAYVIGGALAIVLGTTAGVGWREWQESARVAEAERYAQATVLLRRDQPEEAARAFAELAEESDTGFGVLARLRAAAAEGTAGDPGARAAQLNELAANDDVPELYRELSQLLLLQEQIEELGPEQAIERLEPLTAEDSAWRHSALELLAVAQLSAGETLAARETLGVLVADASTPAGIGRRAVELLDALGGPIEEAEDVPDDAAGGSS